MQKLAEICVRRPVFATMLILSLTVVGVFSFRSLGVDLFPKIDLPTITVSVINPGASPQEIETEITDKVEGAVNTISGIDELRSTSVEGVSQVFISFVLEKNADVAAQEVRNKIELIVNELPETAEAPIVQKLDTDATPVLRIAVSAPRSLREVTDMADKQIKRQIEPISGVGNVEIVGGRQREIEVWVDPDKMRAFNISAADVANAVKAQNMELPGGRPRGSLECDGDGFGVPSCSLACATACCTCGAGILGSAARGKAGWGGFRSIGTSSSQKSSYLARVE